MECTRLVIVLFAIGVFSFSIVGAMVVPPRPRHGMSAQESDVSVTPKDLKRVLHSEC